MPSGRIIPLFVVAMISGCLGAGEVPGGLEDPPGLDWPRCEHPYPCGDEWPANLVGPFEFAGAETVEIESHDGIALQGWVYTPKVPEAVRLPTILIASPYLPDVEEAPEPGSFITAATERGFAVARVAVRGTGASGGCYEKEGTNERQDHAFLVEWFASQPWSNGRVGMYGLSYEGQTQIHAAIEGAPSLKTIIAGGVESMYLYYATPQGAISTNGGGYEAARYVLARGGVPDPTTGTPMQKLERVIARTCPVFAQNLVAAQRAQVSDDRDGDFWNERDYYSHYPTVTASTFIFQGFVDPWVYWGQDEAWRSLHKAPKAFLFGQWSHEFPTDDALASRGGEATFRELALDWYDFWLKGIGPAPQNLGTAEYQLPDDAWRRSTAWPPVEADDRALYLSDFELSATPSANPRSFRAMPNHDPRGAVGLVCADVPSPQGLAYLSPRLEQAVTLAGNPFALVRLTSDLMGGQIGLHVFDVGESCDDARLLTFGVADLRFHEGGFDAKPFPASTPTDVRIDFRMVSEIVAAGRRIAVVATSGGPLEPSDQAQEYLVPGTFMTKGRSGQPYHPTLILAGESHLVLPVLEGELGASLPRTSYPPRPFVPPPADAAQHR